MKRRGVKKLETFIGLEKADLHIHSIHSDGKATVPEILDWVEHKTDLNVIAITDHDTLDGALEAQKLMKEKEFRFELIVGEEVSTSDGHLLGLFLKERVPANLSCEETAALIKKQGGLVVASHPFQHTKFSDHEMITMDGIGTKNLYDLRFYLDGIEVVNATPTLMDENIAASAFNSSFLRVAETGGSDSHIKEAIGMGYTIFEGKGSADLKRAIRQKQTRGIYGRWSLMALLKYLFFFIPIGLRLVWSTVFGRKPRLVIETDESDD